MIVVMQAGAKEEQIQHVIDRLVAMGFDVHRSTGASHTVLGAVGAGGDFDTRDIEVVDGVREVVYFTRLTAVLFNFPSRYLCTIGLGVVFSLRPWSA